MFKFRNPFKKEKKESTVVNDYYEECKKEGLTDEQIIRRFIEKNLPTNWLQSKLQQEVIKMPDKENFEDEIVDEEQAQELEAYKQSKKKVKAKEEQPTINDVLNNILNRLTAIEAYIFRVKNA
jgi:hypothetical protein